MLLVKSVQSSPTWNSYSRPSSQFSEAFSPSVIPLPWGALLWFCLPGQTGQQQVSLRCIETISLDSCHCIQMWVLEQSTGCCKQMPDKTIQRRLIFIICWVYDCGMCFADLLLIQSKRSAKDVFLLSGWVFLIKNTYCTGGISMFCEQSASYSLLHVPRSFMTTSNNWFSGKKKLCKLQ